MWRELRAPVEDPHNLQSTQGAKPKTLRQAVVQIVLADVSMSIDNVLGVAGAAREHTAVLVLGLTLSVALMGLASNLLAGVLGKYRWIGFLGLAVILWVALHMIWEGSFQIAEATGYWRAEAPA